MTASSVGRAVGASTPALCGGVGVAGDGLGATVNVASAAVATESGAGAGAIVCVGAAVAADTSVLREIVDGLAVRTA